MLGRFSLGGDLDGHGVDVVVRQNSSYFTQATLPYSYEVLYDDDRGMLRLSFTSLIGTGVSSPATGTIVMPSGAPRAGETICVEEGTLTMTQDPDAGVIGMHFVFDLTGLSAPASGPLGPNCPGTSIAGHLSGCAQ